MTGSASASFRGFPDEAFAFFEGLEADNSKTYWTAHRQIYEETVRAPLVALLAELEPTFGEAKLFRPYRDVRFSSDKSPYKTHQGAFCDVVDGVGWYIQVSADGLVTAGGFYGHSPAQTARYRAAVDAPGSGTALVKIMKTLAGYGFTPYGEQVRTRPRGFSADHPRIDLIRYKGLSATHDIPPDDRMNTSAIGDIVRTDWKRLRPLVDWVVTHVGPG